MAEREKPATERQAEHKASAWAATLKSVARYVAQNPGASTRNISESVSGNARTVRAALDELVDRGEIRAVEGPRNARNHYLETGTQSDTDEDHGK